MNAPDIIFRFLAENQLVTHEIAQGTQEWHAFRGKFFGASEAAAMLGLSKKVTRNELLHAKSSGIAKEFSDFVQERILDRGHEVEAQARPIIEEKIERSLYNATFSRGRLSYSSDGITAAGDLCFEHKQWNAELAESVAAGILPDEHWPQCQQALLVSGAERLIFVVSDGTADKMVSMEVLPDHDKYLQLLAGWAQFEKDMAEYQHIVEEPQPVGRAPDQLPALRIELVGQVTDSNLDKFHGHALAVIGAIKTDLQTDEDFADAAKTVKWCNEVEEKLEAAKQHALSQTESIEKLFRTIDSIKEEARQTRLKLSNLVESRKKSIRVELVQSANTKYAEHIETLQAEIKGVLLSRMLTTPDFGGAIKGLKTITSLRNAIDTELANGKIAADAKAKDVRDKLEYCKENAAGYGGLFADLQQLVGYEMDAFKAVIANRIGEHKAAEAAKEEATRQRIQQEEEAKAQAKAKAEQDALIAKAQAEERAKIEAEARAKAEAEKPAPVVAPVETPAPVQRTATEEPDSGPSPAADQTAAGSPPNDHPTRDMLITCVALGFEVNAVTAEQWLIAEFSAQSA